ncbi:MAG TPA: transglycosylase SLT domain-containing protein [Pyrinomonadaceae bacterium]|nr:transglycosylase SLT domain-containing protein [Pyrinomonadaceae bacterium]
MLFYKNLRFQSFSILSIILFGAGLLLVPFTTSCSAFVSQMSEEQAAQILRNLTKDGKLPAESVVLDIENRYAKTRTGALAKLLRAHIRFENNDFNGAAAILNSDVFRRKTNIADYALWLRGRALQNAGNHSEAMNVFAELVRSFPTSLRAREGGLLWADSALKSGQAAQIPNFLKDLIDKNDPDALLLTAKSYESQNNQSNAVAFYRKVYFYGAGGDAGREAEAKLISLGQNLAPQTAEEILTRAAKLFAAEKYREAADAYSTAVLNFPNVSTPQTNLKRIKALTNSSRMSEANSVFNVIPPSAPEKIEGYYQLANGYANARQWEQARSTINEMRQKFPSSDLTAKALIDAGMIARKQKNKPDETYFLKTAVAAYPNAVAVAGAQFELAWTEHENDNFQTSSQMLTEHLARYVDKDSTNRGKAGYWAARDSERAEKFAESCALYDGVIYRYAANWYGYLANQRVANLRGQNKCRANAQFPAGSLVPRAVANLKIVTVAPETATEKELERAGKSEELSIIGLFDWAIDELQEAQKTAPNSPKVNLALAKHFRFKQDNTSALLALAKSYPDYSQMFPEELGREEWEIFYPLTNWQDIKYWAKARNLDHYQVAGFIRQETIFSPRAKSKANAYGLMQLLIPTARAVARKYNASTTEIYAETLFQPRLNIELGTAYIRDQLNKFGRVEYAAVAYNAGPGRVPQWRATLPFEIDEFVEAIPFRETKGYVQGIIRNSAQYRRLYDDSGNFKANVGANPLRGTIDSKSSEQLAAEVPDLKIDGDTAE